MKITAAPQYGRIIIESFPFKWNLSLKESLGLIQKITKAHKDMIKVLTDGCGCDSDCNAGYCDDSIECGCVCHLEPDDIENLANTLGVKLSVELSENIRLSKMICDNCGHPRTSHNMIGCNWFGSRDVNCRCKKFVTTTE